ncbi:MAG: hypothetical protein K6C35_00120 [Eubacterium sp.]|nr:hypothetical protein [Eubacterium sp.]
MKYCIYCGAQLGDESSFCNICGGRQPSSYIDNSKSNDVHQASVRQNNMNGTAQNVQQYYMNHADPNVQQYSMNQAVPNAQQYSMNQAVPNAQQYNMNSAAPYPQQYSINSASQNLQQYNMNQIAQNNQQAAGDTGLYSQQLASGTVPNPHKSKKKIIIPIVVLLVIGLGVGGFFLFKKLTKKPQEKVLDGFFEALNDMDIDKAETYCAPAGTERYGDMIQYGALSNLYTNRFGFIRGAFDIYDKAFTDEDLRDMYLKSYGFNSAREGGLDKERQCEENNDMFRMKYSDFHVEYDLVSLKPASEYTISYQYRTKQIEIEDIASTIEANMELEEGDVTDVYVAKIHIKWKYGDKKYGYDKNWWSNSAFDKIKDSIHDDRGNELRSYNEVVNYYDNKVYNVFFYQYKGKWYIFNPLIIRYYYAGWRAE